MRLALSVLSVALLAVCTSLPQPASPPAPAAVAQPTAELPPPDDTLNATAWFQTSVERDLVFREIYRAAAEKLPAALADKGWDALTRGDHDNDLCYIGSDEFLAVSIAAK